jgi:cobalt-precorrin 5A hydrolase
MTDTVVISLPHFAIEADRIARVLNADQKEYHRDAFVDAFRAYRRIVAVMSTGIVVRAIAPLIHDKWDDPAVVVVSPDLRYAVPLLGGHHGANVLARDLIGAGLIPVITTATEAMGKESVEGIATRSSCDIMNRDSTRVVNAAMLEGEVPVYTVPGPGVVIAGPQVSILLRPGEYVVGIGCRRGIAKEEVIAALERAFSDAGMEQNRILAFATTSKKKKERGLMDAIAQLGGNLIFLDDQTINAQKTVSASKAGTLGLKGVAEPCALALSRRKELVMSKRVYGGVTVAVAR